jgi:hypothetical protein
MHLRNRLGKSNTNCKTQAGVGIKLMSHNLSQKAEKQRMLADHIPHHQEIKTQEI